MVTACHAGPRVPAVHGHHDQLAVHAVVVLVLGHLVGAHHMGGHHTDAPCRAFAAPTQFAVGLHAAAPHLHDVARSPVRSAGEPDDPIVHEAVEDRDLAAHIHRTEATFSADAEIGTVPLFGTQIGHTARLPEAVVQRGDAMEPRHLRFHRRPVHQAILGTHGSGERHPLAIHPLLPRGSGERGTCARLVTIQREDRLAVLLRTMGIPLGPRAAVVVVHAHMDEVSAGGAIAHLALGHQLLPSAPYRVD